MISFDSEILKLMVEESSFFLSQPKGVHRIIQGEAWVLCEIPHVLLDSEKWVAILGACFKVIFERQSQ